MPAEEYVTSFGIRNKLYIFIKNDRAKEPGLRQALTVSRHLMNIPQELRILILQLVAKHPSLKDDYSLMRFFAKSSILPDKLLAAKNDMVESRLMIVEDTRNTVKHYKVTTKGLALLAEHNLTDYLSSFALQIDKSEFILKIINLLEKNKNDQKENGG